MKHLILLSILLLLLLLGTAYADPVTVVNCDEYVSLRTEPSTKSDALAQIPLGTHLERFSAKDGFSLVEYGGVHGYVLNTYLLPYGLEENMKLTIVNCDEWVSLRSAPSHSADVIIKIPLNEKVVFIKTGEGFCKVSYKYNNRQLEGWIDTGYLSSTFFCYQNNNLKSEYYAYNHKITITIFSPNPDHPLTSESEWINLRCDDRWGRTIKCPGEGSDRFVDVLKGDLSNDVCALMYCPGEGLYCLDIENGDVRWLIEMPISGYCSPRYMHDGNIYICGYDSGEIASIDKYGNINWHSKLPFSGEFLLENVNNLNDHNIYVLGYDSDEIASINENGNINWHSKLSLSKNSSIYYLPGNNICILDSESGEVTAIDENGNINWQYKSEDEEYHPFNIRILSNENVEIRLRKETDNSIRYVSLDIKYGRSSGIK